MTPHELSEMLAKWKADEEFEVRIQNPNPGNPNPSVILAQGLNSINLTGEDR